MEITDRIHLVRHNFLIPVSPEKSLERYVYSMILFNDEITLIDAGVKGSHDDLFAYIRKNGRSVGDITRLILSHAHPDHIGSAAEIKARTGCVTMAHEGDKDWIENITLQNNQRPVPGFFKLVDRPVNIDYTLSDNEDLRLGPGWHIKILHTPGHSKGSLSFYFPDENILFTADAVPVAGDIPNYDNYSELKRSLRKIKEYGVNMLLSSWAEPANGEAEIQAMILQGDKYLDTLNTAVMEFYSGNNPDHFENCINLVHQIGLPPVYANPLAHRAFLSHLACL